MPCSSTRRTAAPKAWRSGYRIAKWYSPVVPAGGRRVTHPALPRARGTPGRPELKRALKDLPARPIEIPLVIGGKEVRTGKTTDAVMPHCHRHVLAKVHQAGPTEVRAAVAAAREAWRDWSAWSPERRAARVLKAAGPPARPDRPRVDAAPMPGPTQN